MSGPLPYVWSHITVNKIDSRYPDPRADDPAYDEMLAEDMNIDEQTMVHLATVETETDKMSRETRPSPLGSKSSADFCSQSSNTSPVYKVKVIFWFSSQSSNTSPVYKHRGKSVQYCPVVSNVDFDWANFCRQGKTGVILQNMTNSLFSNH